MHLVLSSCSLIQTFLNPLPPLFSFQHNLFETFQLTLYGPNQTKSAFVKQEMEKELAQIQAHTVD